MFYSKVMRQDMLTDNTPHAYICLWIKEMRL